MKKCDAQSRLREFEAKLQVGVPFDAQLRKPRPLKVGTVEELTIVLEVGATNPCPVAKYAYGTG